MIEQGIGLEAISNPPEVYPPVAGGLSQNTFLEMASSSDPEKPVADPVRFCILYTEAVFDPVRFFVLFSLCGLEHQWPGYSAADRIQIVSHSCHSYVCHTWHHLSSIFVAG